MSCCKFRICTVCWQDISQGLFHEFQKAADKGLTSYYLNQNIKLIPPLGALGVLETMDVGTGWPYLDPELPGIQGLQDRHLQGLPHRSSAMRAYAGVQGCSFFELKVCW
ncbi:unnamed protein product [Symbiodinium necroappetens]|uniref:Uncharacterized protein n=1 Tax=Symbiodinium necroappetens TaxID=1628268 RepID=A0A812WTS4_9DINO|nr:unnamed protein product [Symbiodinium necroappetens]